ncbi:lysosomal acid glucosylceramidase-like [Littorina saxatilis]|uniref:Glucosylceramidase n=1 Tax=Littorina saxatilis TaxID=31220 RepID=A0AAN9C3D3_9CAEN
MWSATRFTVSHFVLLLACLHQQACSTSSSLPCNLRGLGNGNSVCVCNATYCDTVTPLPQLTEGQVAVYSSSEDGERLAFSAAPFLKTSTGLVYEVLRNKTRQSIIGFGGAFTDSAGINIASLPQAAQDKLLQSYFAPEGIEYNIGRVPMASCDFSTHQYSYDDVDGDFQLQHFALAPEDLKYKIPFIQRAMAMSKRGIKMFGSPWSAPAWMKTNKNMTGNGTLIGQPGGPYYRTWANYFVRFLQEYQKHNITFWGLTAQNEPTDGYIYKHYFQAMGFTPEQQRDFIKLDLGPALHNNSFGDVKLMMLDDNRLLLPYWAEKVLSDPEAAKYVSGIGIHWYVDQFSPLLALDLTHQEFPDKFILATEATVKVVKIGVWDHAQSYASDILDDLNHWVTGWTDWNIALSTIGGPNWVHNLDNSPIFVNATAKEFYKQPMFYAMGHFSKFLPPGSVYLEMAVPSPSPYVKAAAFLRPDSNVAAVFLNMDSSSVLLSIKDGSRYVNFDMQPYSLRTFIWK